MTWIHWVYLLGIPVSYAFALAFTKATERYALHPEDYLGMFFVTLFWPIVVTFILLSLPVKWSSNVLANLMKGLIK